MYYFIYIDILDTYRIKKTRYNEGDIKGIFFYQIIKEREREINIEKI